MLFFLLCALILAGIMAAVIAGKKDYLGEEDTVFLSFLVLMPGSFIAVAIMVGAGFSVIHDSNIESQTHLTQNLKTVESNNGPLYLYLNEEEETYEYLAEAITDNRKTVEAGEAYIESSDVVEDSSTPRVETTSTTYKAWWYAPFALPSAIEERVFYVPEGTSTKNHAVQVEAE